jgi:hypothetical protein
MRSFFICTIPEQLTWENRRYKTAGCKTDADDRRSGRPHRRRRIARDLAFHAEAFGPNVEAPRGAAQSG